MVRPIRILFGFVETFLFLTLLTAIPTYWKNPLLIAILVLLFVWLLVATLLED